MCQVPALDMPYVLQATGNKCACKILPGKTSQGDKRSNIIKEVAVLQQISQHPYTISLYDAYEHDGKYYLIMEICTGGELFDQFAQKVSSALLCMLVSSS